MLNILIYLFIFVHEPMALLFIYLAYHEVNLEYYLL